MKHFFLFIALVAGLSAGAQQIELDASGYGEKKFKMSEKKVHIASFKINYQVLYSASDYEAGGRTVGGGMKGDAKASLAIGLKGPTSEDLVKTTDEIYQAFTKRLSDEGYTLLGLDKLSNFEPYEDWTKVTGGIGSEAQVPGAITVSPTGFDYMVKKVKKDGKEKTGQDPAFGIRMGRLSKALGGALILHINLTVSMAKPGKDFKTGLASALGAAAVSAQTDLRLVGTNAGWPVMGIYFSKKMGDEGMAAVNMKDDVPIPGVLESKLYRAMAVKQVDWGSSAGMYTFFSPDDVEMKNVQPIDIDASAYYGGVKSVMLGFLNKSLDYLGGYLK